MHTLCACSLSYLLLLVIAIVSVLSLLCCSFARRKESCYYKSLIKESFEFDEAGSDCSVRIFLVTFLLMFVALEA